MTESTQATLVKLGDTDRYVTADFIDRISGDKVVLTPDKNQILSDRA